MDSNNSANDNNVHEKLVVDPTKIKSPKSKTKLGDIRDSTSNKPRTKSKSYEVHFNSFSKYSEISFLHERENEVISVGALLETYIGKLYKMVVSSVITTVFMDDNYFSYLTNPVNDDKNFFLLREGDYFDINQWDPSLTRDKISEDKMQEFVSQLNFFFSTNDILNIIDTYQKKSRLNIICFIFTILILLGSIILLWRVLTTAKDHIYLVIIFGIITFLLLLLNLRMLYSSIWSGRKEKMNYDIFRNLLKHREMVEDHVQKWNDEYFIKNGIVAYSTSIVNYIHFSQENDKNIILSNNQLPE